MFKKVKCPICRHYFTPKSFGSKYCSIPCRRIAERRRVAESNRRLSEKRKEDRLRMERDGILDKRPTTKVRRPLANPRYPNGKMTAAQEAEVRRIMRLPVERRWKEGAKDWGHLEQSLARKIDRAQRTIFFEGVGR